MCYAKFTSKVNKITNLTRSQFIFVTKAITPLFQTSEAERQHMEAKYSCDALIAENKKTYEMKQAEFTQEVNKSKAEAELAYELQAAKVGLTFLVERFNLRS